MSVLLDSSTLFLCRTRSDARRNGLAGARPKTAKHRLDRQECQKKCPGPGLREAAWNLIHTCYRERLNLPKKKKGNAMTVSIELQMEQMGQRAKKAAREAAEREAAELKTGHAE